jgi:hypothetical protein
VLLKILNYAVYEDGNYSSNSTSIRSPSLPKFDKPQFN